MSPGAKPWRPEGPVGRLGLFKFLQIFKMTEHLDDTISTALRHIFLQTLMKRSYLQLEELEELLAILRVEDPGSRDAQQLLALINLDISPYGFEVKQIRYKDETYVGFINKEADAYSSKATGYRSRDGKPNVAYTAYFRSLLEAIAVCDAVAGGIPKVSDQDAYYLPIQVAGGHGTDDAGRGSQLEGPSTQQAGTSEEGNTLNMSLGDRQKALDAFVEDGWLSREGTDAVGLGPRTLLELSHVVLRTEGVSESVQLYVNERMGL